jgi:membrane associated rhomboid family serine protease
MPRLGPSPFSFPGFRGFTRQVVLINVGAFFALFVGQNLVSATSIPLVLRFGFVPTYFLHGALWQPLTSSFVHPSIVGTLFELLSLWFLAGFLEDLHPSNWVLGLYASSVLGTVAAALAIYAVAGTLGFQAREVPLYGCFGGIFGMLVAMGVLYGEMEFLLLFLIGIKAKYLAIIYVLISLAMLFTEQRMYAFAQLGGAAAGLLYIRMASRRGVTFGFSEKWYGVRNRYYRWKRRRAAKKFEVYMRSQGRTVRFDGQGRQLDDDPDDKKRWN